MDIFFNVIIVLYFFLFSCFSAVITGFGMAILCVQLFYFCLFLSLLAHSRTATCATLVFVASLFSQSGIGCYLGLQTPRVFNIFNFFDLETLNFSTVRIGSCPHDVSSESNSVLVQLSGILRSYQI